MKVTRHLRSTPKFVFIFHSLTSFPVYRRLKTTLIISSATPVRPGYRHYRHCFHLPYLLWHASAVPSNTPFPFGSYTCTFLSHHSVLPCSQVTAAGSAVSVSISTGNTEKTGKWQWLSGTFWTSSLALLEGRDVIMLCREQSWIFPWLPLTETLRKASVKSELWISRAKLNHTGTIEREITCGTNSQYNSIFVCSVHSAFNDFCSQLPHVWIQWPRQPVPRDIIQIIPVPVN